MGMDDPNKPNGQHLPLSHIIPNLITLLALISGITSLQKAIIGEYETAVLLLLAAAVFDVLDGAVARALNAQSEMLHSCRCCLPMDEIAIRESILQ